MIKLNERQERLLRYLFENSDCRYTDRRTAESLVKKGLVVCEELRVEKVIWRRGQTVDFHEKPTTIYNYYISTEGYHWVSKAKEQELYG